MKLEKILKWIVIGGIFLLPFIPLIVSSGLFFPFIAGKNFAFRIIVEIIFGAWIVLAFLDKNYRPKFSWISISVCAFVLIMAVADIFSQNPYKSFWSNFERMEGLVTLLHLLAYFFVVGSILNTEKLWNWFLNFTVGVSVIEIIYGLLQLAGKVAINQSGTRLDGTLGNAAYLGAYMLIHIFITVFLILKWRGANLVKWLYGIIAFFQFLILYYTETRGAFLGFLAGVIVFLIIVAIGGKNLSFEKEGLAKFRKISIGILIAVIVLIGAFFLGISYLASLMPYAGWAIEAAITPLIAIFIARFITLLYELGEKQQPAEPAVVPA